MPLPQQHLAISPKRVLLVEDEPLVAQTIRMVLSADGHSVQLCDSAEQALSIFDASNFDLILTDFKLGGMDGLELAQSIKAICPDKPIILITAFAERISTDTGKVSNIDLLVRKPFSVAELQGALRTIFPAG